MGKFKKHAQKLYVQLKRFIYPKALILAYHRVFTPKTDPQLLCVTPKNFEEHLKILAQYYSPLSLQQLTQNLSKKKIPRKTIVITFDDGYVDNFAYAKPLLEKYNIPATIFVTTSYINKNKEFWWDELERIILTTPKLPSQLTLTIAQQNYTWNLAEQKNHLQNHRYWDVTKSPPSDRHKLYLELHSLLKQLPHQEKEIVLQYLVSWAQISPNPRNFYRVVTEDELQKLSISPFIEIGSHSSTHSQLSSQSQLEQKQEILHSKFFIEKIINKPITSFSYPFGSLNDIGETIPKLLKKHNYSIATANFPNLISKSSNPYLLPRYLVRNWDGKTFHTNLKKWIYAQ